MNSNATCEICEQPFVKHSASQHCPLVVEGQATKADLGDVFKAKREAA